MSEKKALQLASVASMIDQFNIPNIELLQSLGYSVDVAADFTTPGTITAERAENLKTRLNSMGVRVFDIAIPRSLNPKAIRSAYKQVKALLKKESYKLLHCHSPIGGAIARRAAKGERKKGLRVIYTAHGFHFFDGAPLKNWLVFYPVEKWLSRYTDVLITINEEDYERATKRFKAKQTVYVPGVGVDLNRFNCQIMDREEKREQLGLKNNEKIILSVGELSANKNHEVVIEAIGKLQDPSIHYFIAGRGELGEKLRKKAEQQQVNLHLLGFRTDINELIQACDLFVFPSLREGLPVALMEAMASGAVCLASNIRGNRDLLQNPDYRVESGDVAGWREKIETVLSSDNSAVVEDNLRRIKAFSAERVKEKMEEIYGT